MRIFVCGNCGGALEIEETATTSVCIYCGFTNDITSLEGNLEAFRSEVRDWLTDLGVVEGSGMDATMRKLYLQNHIYPSLCTEFSNLIGDTEDILDLPLIYLPLYKQIPDLTIRTTWSPNQGKPLKDFSRKLESEELSGFAADPESQFLIEELRVSSLMTPMLMDVMELNLHPSVENFERGSKTLSYLVEQIVPVTKIPTKDEANKDLQTYYELVTHRLKLGADVLSKYAQIIRDREVHEEEEWCQMATKTVEEMRIALKEIKHLSVIDRVLMDTGLENDSSALSACYNVTSLYTKITSVPYESFINAITNLSNQTILYNPPSRSAKVDLSWFSYSMTTEKFSWYLSILHKTMTDNSFRIMAERDDMEKWVSKIKNPTGFYLYPFFLLKVRSILKSGFLLWKKGEEETFYSMCDGAFNLYPGFSYGDFPILMTPGFKKMIDSKLEKNIMSLLEVDPQPLPFQWLSLPPCVSSSNAEMLYSAAHNFLEEAEFSKEEGQDIEIPSSYKDKGFDTGKVKALDPDFLEVVYLPMVIENGQPRIMGKHLDLDEDVPHRMRLASFMTEFINRIGASQA
jgi:hypothetical protein